MTKKLSISLLILLILTSSLTFGDDLNKYTVEYHHQVLNKTDVTQDVQVELMSFSKDNSNYYRLLSESTNEGTNIFKEYSAFTYTFKGLEPNKLATLKKFYDVNLYPRAYNIIPSKVTNSVDSNEGYLNPEKYIVSDDPLIKETAKKIVGKETNFYEKAKLLYAFVASEMVYDAKSPIASSGSYSAIRDILRKDTSLTDDLKKGLVYNPETDDYDLETFTTQEGGLCFDYATLLVALMRAEGIPSRVVVGYVVTEENVAELRKNGEVNITENPHAWVEVYLAPYGWVHVDPTVSGLDFDQAKENFIKGGALYLKQGYNFPFIKYKASASAVYSSKVLLKNYMPVKGDTETPVEDTSEPAPVIPTEPVEPEVTFDRTSLAENVSAKKQNISKYYEEIQSKIDAKGAIDYIDSKITENTKMSRAKAFSLMYLITEQYGPYYEKDWMDLEGHWAEESIESLSTSKIANGYPDGTMKPDKFITEEESATIMNNRFDLSLSTFSVMIKDFIMGIRTYIFR